MAGELTIQQNYLYDNFDKNTRTTTFLEENSQQNNSVFDTIDENTDKTVSYIKEEHPEKANQKVSFKEGISLFGKGVVDKMKGMATAIIKHPVQTVAAVAGTAAIIAAAPLVGIASATAAAALTVGFGIYAVGKTGYDIIETIKDNKEERYDEVRQDLQQLGGDGVDLAMALPYMPKAINQLTRFGKYGTSTLGLNNKLISDLKNSDNVLDVILNFKKANTLINYEMIGNEMGLNVKPELNFNEYNYYTSADYIKGSYCNLDGKITMEEQYLTGMADLYSPTESALRHELEHFQQFSDIARTIGIDDFQNLIIDNTLKNVQGSVSKEEIISIFNKELYEQVINSKGAIQQGTKEAEHAYKLIDAFKNYISASENLEAYEVNLLEQEARATESQYITQSLCNKAFPIRDLEYAISLVEESNN